MVVVDWRQGVLRIENEGAHLSREALLFGTTSKMGRADLIGKFGEGLKLGVLALVRAGRPVTIRSGSEVWNPTSQAIVKTRIACVSRSVASSRAMARLPLALPVPQGQA